MERFGKDNPDLRFGLELKDITDLAPGCGFQGLRRRCCRGRARARHQCQRLGDYSRKQLDELAEFVKKFGAKGLAYLALTQ